MRMRMLATVCAAVLCFSGCDLFIKKTAGYSDGFILVDGGSYRMGSKDGNTNELPIRDVTVASFYIAKFETTCGEYYRTMSNKPWETYNDMTNMGDSYPATGMDWYAAILYCNRRSQMEDLKPVYTIDALTRDPNNKNAYDELAYIVTADFKANGYRLPTEAEWEYAARGGRLTQNFAYSGSATLSKVGWCEANASEKIRPVGLLDPNELGIYDMSGNVSEWCWDWYAPYNVQMVSNPTGASGGSTRVLRGGSYLDEAVDCRVSSRNKEGDGYPNYWNIDRGFRIVRNASDSQ